MMKRTIAICLTLLMICSAAVAESTNTVGLAAFLELYASRYANFAKDNGLEFDVSIYSGLTPYESGDYLMFESTAGSIGVSPESYGVRQLIMTYYAFSASDSHNEKLATSLVMALSALEFDASYEQGLSFAKKSAVDDAATMFNEKIGSILESSLSMAMETGDRVFLCSCNYDYYLQYVNRDGHEFFYIIAEAR